MLSLIEVTCPHCGARGQIMLPPLGAIIVGPCPECQGMVTVFCGRVLPLDRDIMVSGKPRQKRQHLMDVITLFVNERVEKLFADTSEDPLDPATALEETFGDPGESSAFADLGEDAGPLDIFGNAPDAPIMPEELDSFRNVDLKLIDNPEYFKAVFEV